MLGPVRSGGVSAEFVALLPATLPKLPDGDFTPVPRGAGKLSNLDATPKDVLSTEYDVALAKVGSTDVARSTIAFGIWRTGWFGGATGSRCSL